MITVFTPTYNRGYILRSLYESLKRQTYQDFEWLIVDDGSIDDTQDLIKLFKDEDIIRIRYFLQANGGKHRAINKGVIEARGEWFFIVDSDDCLPYDSLANIFLYASQVEHIPTFGGVAGNKCYTDGKTVGGDVYYDVVDSDTVEIREHYHVKGDMAEVWRTSILKQYPFPEYPCEKFFSEGYIWSQISLKYKIRYFNRNIYTCEYLEDGLTKNIRRQYRNSPRGAMLMYSSISRDKRYRIKTRLIASINYWRYTIGWQSQRTVKPKWWGYALYPLGVLFYYLDLKKK